jgi:hypothetical protein
MTTKIESKIINQPYILHILVAFWVLFSHKTFKDPYTKLPLCREMKTKTLYVIKKCCFHKKQKKLFLAPTPTNGVYDRNFPYA